MNFTLDGVIYYFVGFSIGILLCDFIERKYPDKIRFAKGFIFGSLKKDE